MSSVSVSNKHKIWKDREKTLAIAGVFLFAESGGAKIMLSLWLGRGMTGG